MKLDDEMILVTPDGKEVSCKVISNFTINDINYIAYTDGTKTSDGLDELYVSKYTVENGEFNLQEIKSDYEWQKIDKYLDEFLFCEDE